MEHFAQRAAKLAGNKTAAAGYSTSKPVVSKGLV
jgi:hypothetical protein